VLLESECSTQEIADATGVEKKRFSQKPTRDCPIAATSVRWQTAFGTVPNAVNMSLKPAKVDSSANNFVYAIATLTFSGNHPTGGDTLDFTQIADKLPSRQMVQVFAESQNGNSGYYISVQGTALKQLAKPTERPGRTDW